MAITGQPEIAESNSKITAFSSAKEGLPVFRGLDDVTISGKEIAAIAGVTPPTFSRWRAGQVRVPESKLVFLTLLLAHWIDELETLLNNRDFQGRSRIKTSLNTTRRCLVRQEVINQALPPETVREGSHLFRRWWFQEDAGAIKKAQSTPWNESLFE